MGEMSFLPSSPSRHHIGGIHRGVRRQHRSVTSRTWYRQVPHLRQCDHAPRPRDPPETNREGKPADMIECIGLRAFFQDALNGGMVIRVKLAWATTALRDDSNKWKTPGTCLQMFAVRKSKYEMINSPNQPIGTPHPGYQHNYRPGS